MNEVAFDWLDRRKDERFFLFLHYMDPHDPYFEHPYNGVGIARVSMPEPEPEMAERLHELYRGEIEYLDVQFGEAARQSSMQTGSTTTRSSSSRRTTARSSTNTAATGMASPSMKNRSMYPSMIKWAKHSEGQRSSGAELGHRAA